MNFNDPTNLYILMKALAHTRSAIVNDDDGVVVGLVVSEAVQHLPHHSFHLPLAPYSTRFLISPLLSDETPLHLDSYMLRMVP